MSNWYRKDVGDGVEAFAPTGKLFDAFTALAMTGVTPNISVFSRYDLEQNVVSWWFSPEAHILAQAFGAEPCEKPKPSSGFGLLVGDANAWEGHFPGYIASSRNEF